MDNYWGRRNSITRGKVSGGFLTTLAKYDYTNENPVWIPIETSLKIMQMPKVMAAYHADTRILTICEKWFPKAAKRSIGITPQQRAADLLKARELISAESKDIKWLQKMIKKKKKTAPYLKRVLADSRTKRTSEKKAVHEAKLTNTSNTSIAWYDPAIDGDLYQDISFDGKEIVRDWFRTPEDDIDCLTTDFTLSEEEGVRPTLFPAQLWKYVEDIQRQG